MAARIVVAGAIARGGAVRDGWLEVDGDRVADAGDGAPPRAPDVAHAGLIAPGFVDLQVNGAAGHDVTDGEAAVEAIEAALLRHGITSFLATVVSTDPERAAAAVDRL